jgi:hypothetical protein
MGENTTKLDLVGAGSDSAFSMIEPADAQEEYNALFYPQNIDKKRI